MISLSAKALRKSYDGQIKLGGITRQFARILMEKVEELEQERDEYEAALADRVGD